MHQLRRLILLIAGGCLFAGTSLSHAADTRIELAAFNGGHAVLTLAASPLLAMTEIPFAIDLRTAGNAPLTVDAVDISLDMPAMPMPRNAPRVTWQDGAWRGRAIFTMAGAWQAHAVIRTADGRQEKLTFEIAEVLIR